MTEISPPLNVFFSKKDPATQTPLGIPMETPGNNPVQSRKGENAVHTVQKLNTGSKTRVEPPEKSGGVLRGKPGNNPVTQTGTGNSPVQKNLYSKQAPIQPNRGTYSR